MKKLVLFLFLFSLSLSGGFAQYNQSLEEFENPLDVYYEYPVTNITPVSPENINHYDVWGIDSILYYQYDKGWKLYNRYTFRTNYLLNDNKMQIEYRKSNGNVRWYGKYPNLRKRTRRKNLKKPEDRLFVYNVNINLNNIFRGNENYSNLLYKLLGNAPTEMGYIGEMFYAYGSNVEESDVYKMKDSWVIRQKTKISNAKVEYITDANGVWIESIKEEYDEGKNGWNIVKKWVPNYNSAGKLAAILCLGFEPNEKVWLNIEKSVFEYDENGHMEKQTVQNWNKKEKSWKKDFEYLWIYDNDNLIIYDNRYWDEKEDTWLSLRKYIYQYDMKGRIVEVMVQSMCSYFNECMYDRQYFLKYDDQGNLAEIKDQFWNVILNEWTNFRHHFYKFENKFLTQISIQGWDSSKKKWINDLQYNFEYNNSGKLSQKYSKKWNAGKNQWKNHWKYDYFLK